MQPLLTCIYVGNAVALILHEMDAVRWEEWKLFRLPGGDTGFLGLHVPLLAMVLVGLVGLEHLTWWGLLIALAVGLSGLMAFGIHTYQRRGGVAAFGALPSRLILWATLVLSLPQIGLSVYALL
jgi:hypothetical protein